MPWPPAGPPLPAPFLCLAPLAGFSTPAFRQLARRYGCDVTVSEMVSANGFHHGNTRTRNFFCLHHEPGPVGVQLFGTDPDQLLEAAQFAVSSGAAFVDLNCGCPVRKIISGGSGAALLKQPDQILRLVSFLAPRLPVPLTVKTRIGWDAGHPLFPDFVVALQEAGAAALALHGRFATQMYRGEADWSVIAATVARAAIPVMGNGDLTTPALAKQRWRDSGCAGLMIGRGALGHPWIFGQVRAALAGTEFLEPSLAERLAVMLEHARLERSLIPAPPERIVLVALRAALSRYLAGFPGSRELRMRMNRVESLAGLENLITPAAG